MKQINEIKCTFLSLSQNESLARSIVSGFLLPLDPDVEELADLRCAVSEAVTNAIVHGYAKKGGQDRIVIECISVEAKEEEDAQFHIKIIDYGCGIDDVDKALTPFYTTLAGEERSGMGFTIMQTFSDNFSLRSEKGKGTIVEMVKRIKADSFYTDNASTANREKDRLNA